MKGKDCSRTKMNVEKEESYVVTISENRTRLQEIALHMLRYGYFYDGTRLLHVLALYAHHKLMMMSSAGTSL